MLEGADGLDSFAGRRGAESSSAHKIDAAARATARGSTSAGPPGTVPGLSLRVDVMRGRFRGDAVRRGKEKVVVVGATAPSLQDLAPTSTSGGA